jgi:protein-tyrosine kinase
MSKMLDGVRKAPDAIPDLDLSVLVGPGGSDPQPEQAIEARTRLEEPEPKPATRSARAATQTGPGFSGRKISLRLPQNSPALPFDGQQWLANEQYRILRTKLVQHVKRPKMILISSTGPADGKSITAINLAGAMSLKSEANVLLLDCDFRRSAIHAHLGTPETPGLAEVLAGKCNLEDAIVGAEEMPNLWVLPAGKSEGNPVELLDSSRWIETAAQLRALFKYIIVDSPPIAAVADYDLLQTASDGVVMVVRPDQSNRDLCYKALETVPKDKLIGVVMNCVPKFFAGRQYGYGYGYGYGYQ